MFFEMLAACTGVGAFLTPVLGAVAVTTGDTGSCSPVRAASVHVAWGLTNGGNPAYEIHVLENGVLLTTLDASSTFFNKLIFNYIEGSSNAPKFTANWTYTIQIVRIADGVVVQAQVSTAWTRLYGSCP